MRCPICGAKMINKQICPYCKVVDKQVFGASNKKVKEYRKRGDKDLICYTTTLPNDVNKVALWLYTIFLGWCGVNYFIVYRNVRAWYAVCSWIGGIVTLFFKYFYVAKTVAGGYIIWFLFSVAFNCLAINIVLWVCDIFNLFIKKFKVPVVLADKGDI